ncbi:MAG: hypothetical protein BGO49_15905 [Planctomycetales bacterium 71-10]|nr:MAG: hypothetical protein BGO49_15905 [Planctomycetales bacterium 71-10]
MSTWAVFRREYVVSIGRAALFRDRLLAAALAGASVVGCLAAWDWYGLDRASVRGSARFARAAFGVLVAVQGFLAAGFTLPTARAIASERDGKTLDSLLATRLSSAEIILGVMAASLFRFANAALATVPVMVLLVYLGGADPWLPWLACIGLATTAVEVAALSVAASVGSRTAVRAGVAAAGLFYALFVGPATLLMLRAAFLPPLPTWAMTPLLWALDGGPFGLAENLVGVMPRPWGLVEGVFRMAAIQVAVAAGFTAWAIARLRPASRALYDVEGRSGALRALREANRRPPTRRPCGTDPVFWNERYAYRARNRAARLASGLTRLAWMALLAVGVGWYAGPAFVELAERGYGPSAEADRMPPLNPLTRVLAERLVSGSSADPAPGQARLEFNLALRQFTSFLALGLATAACAFGVEGITRERRRDTWSGLLATPLTGGEIVRGKVLGALWRGRETIALLLILWGLGLASGAVHPLGFLAAIAWIVASTPLFAAMGVAQGLRPEDERWPLDPSRWPGAIATVAASAAVLTLVPAAVAAASLFSYEDLRAAAAGGPFTPLEGWTLGRWLGARGVMLTFLAAPAAAGAGSILYLTSLARSFDAAVGRPTFPTPADRELAQT